MTATNETQNTPTESTPQSATPAPPPGFEISSTAVMLEARAEHELSWSRRLVLSQENLVLKALVAGRDVQIEQLQQDINTRDAHSVAVDREMETRAARILDLERALAERERVIAGLLNADREVKDETIKALEDALASNSQAAKPEGNE